jgi:hypothetical protein
MVINTFDLYDILTDIIPGIIGTLFLVVLVVPTERVVRPPGTMFGPGGALLIIAVAYVVGRIIRNINIWWGFNYLQTNSDFLRKLNNFVTPQIIREKVDSIISEPFETKLNSILTYQSELDNALVEEFVSILHQKYNVETERLFIGKLGRENGEHEDESVDTDGSDERRLVLGLTDSVRTVGNSELHGKATLYQRYTIISEFYESISKIFFLAALGFSASIAGTLLPTIDFWSTVWTEVVGESIWLSIGVIGASIFIWFISDLQFRDFDQRRATAFVTDIVKVHEDNQQGP